MNNTLTTPTGLDIRLDVGSRFATAKGNYIITERLFDEKGNTQAFKFCPVTDVKQIGILELREAVASKKVTL
jgi:hypothetical protein